MATNFPDITKKKNVECRLARHIEELQQDAEVRTNTDVHSLLLQTALYIKQQIKSWTQRHNTTQCKKNK